VRIVAPIALLLAFGFGCESRPASFEPVPSGELERFVGTYRNWENAVVANGPKEDSLWYLMTGELTDDHADSEPIHVRLSMSRQGKLEAHLLMDGTDVATRGVKLHWEDGYLKGWRPEIQQVDVVVTVLGDTELKLGLDASRDIVAYRRVGGTAFVGPVPLFGADNGGGREKHFKRERAPE
jgi:hypothetical protein